MERAGPARAAQRDRAHGRRGARPRSIDLGLPLDRAPRVHARRPRRRHRPHRRGVPPRSSREGLAASPIGQVLLDESVLGWGEFELEVMRDHNDNVVIVCSIENIDPMGVHTGDSVTVAPQQTLTDRLYQKLRDQAIAVIRAVGVETGGSNVQFAVNPETEEIVVIEMNPRVSRSTALASKATGFPIAKIAARLAVGYALEEIDNDITQADARELRADDRLRRRQVAALRVREVRRRRRRAHDAHEVGGRGDGDRAHVQAGVREGDALARARRAPDVAAPTRRAARRALEHPGLGPLRRPARGVPPRRDARARSTRRTSIDPWFLRELHVARAATPRRPFARRARRSSRSTPAPPSSPAATPYFYSGWERGAPRATRSRAATARRVVILGSGPEPHRPGHRVRLLLRARRDDGRASPAATR